MRWESVEAHSLIDIQKATVESEVFPLHVHAMVVMHGGKQGQRCLGQTSGAHAQWASKPASCLGRECSGANQLPDVWTRCPVPNALWRDGIESPETAHLEFPPHVFDRISGVGMDDEIERLAAGLHYLHEQVDVLGFTLHVARLQPRCARLSGILIPSHVSRINFVRSLTMLRWVLWRRCAGSVDSR